MYARLIGEDIANRVDGPLLFLRRTVDVGLNEAVEVEDGSGQARLGRIAALDEDSVTVEMLDDTAGLRIDGARVRFFGEPLRFHVGPGLLGRVFNGVGKPLDGGPPLAARQAFRVDGLPLKPSARQAPSEFLETGFTAIDLMNSLVRGQKLPLFSGGGLPHDRIAVDIACNARLPGAGREAGPAAAGRNGEDDFAIVFAGIGIPHGSAEFFRGSLEQSGALARTVLFLNLASDASAQRLLTPRFALTAAEYLAFEEGKHVLVILTDLTNYCEALREVSASRGEVPSRKGYPGYMYSDLATLYERAGRIRGQAGSVTQVPILTMPNDDITHPIPDLTGYITEGQLVLDRELHRRDLYPPIRVLPSLSRLMKDGTGKDLTDADHPALAAQLYAAYAQAQQTRILASVVGEEGLSETDRLYLAFGERFETAVVAQDGRRSLAQSMDAGWQALRGLPQKELTRLSDAQIAAHLGGEHGRVVPDYRAVAPDAGDDGDEAGRMFGGGPHAEPATA
ncbi:MAG: V-type ATP synthase subunit B [Thiohalocapsa sp.]|jgi:V/A-type H+-transporting ATPase subunit B|uniref:V-type ATP synthase subunit B n=1 Tax=Thiohalocapsa sp. TaxID=2497641 RepID=UPI0025D790F2|nr:V-type ATP synthase subunit B [Thiohalocapsa sp.]MCG6940240.1 V-type ATP synthase subunit B [Thiohalocapsa sp.]